MAKPPAPTAQQAQQQVGYQLDWSQGIDPRVGGVLIPYLNGPAALRSYRQMVDQDETVGSMSWLIETTLGQVEWKHLACTDGAEAPLDPRATKYSDLMDEMIVDMKQTWREHVTDAVMMVFMGHSPCEIVMKQRDGVESRFSDGWYGLDTLAPIDPESIMQWLYADYPKNRDLVALRQSTIAGTADIPLWKVNNYRVRSSLGRPMGRSLLSNALRSWQLKNRIQDTEAIGIERELCGLPVFKIPQSDIDEAGEKGSDGQPTPDAAAALARITAAQKAVTDMRFNRSGGLVLPSDSFFDEVEGDRTPKYDFKLVTSAGPRTIDTRTPIRDYDRAIARVALMQFLHLGDRSGGSYGLSDDQSSLAIASLRYIAGSMCTEWNKTIDLTWIVNAWPDKYKPKLWHGNITKEGLEAIGQFFRGLGAMQWMFEQDPGARVQALGLAGISSTQEDQKYVPPPIPTPPASGAPAADTKDKPDATAQ